MRRQAQGQMVRWVSRTAAMAAGAAALFVTGCVRSRPEPGLLGARTLVPAPFVEPAAASSSAALPAEPAFTGTTIVPAGAAIIPAAPLDENLVMTPMDSIDDVKPVKSVPSKSVAAPRSDGERQTYIVKKGDSLWLIARRYGVTVAELTAENSIPESKVLRIGQSIALPRGARFRDVPEIKHAAPRHASTAPSSSKPRTSSTAKASTGTAKSASASSSSSRKAGKEPIPADGMYTIKSGDNPWDLSRKFGVKHEELMQWNDLKSDTVLQVGQKIRLRGAASEGAAATAAAVPAVKPAIPVVAPDATAAPAGAVLTEAPLAPPVPGTAPVVGAEAPAAPTPAATLPADATGAGAAALAPATTGAPTIPAGALDLPKKLSHSVTEGETLQIIAEMYGTTVDAIKKENPTVKTDADLLPNLKLMVPYR